MIPKLDPNDAKLFYELWIPLLDYVNQMHRVNPRLGHMTTPAGLDTDEVRIVSDFLWKHPEIIDQYLRAVEMPLEHREIVESWKRFVLGEFILERHLKRGSVFISKDDAQVYSVCGIYSTWEEMLPYAPTPIYLRATLIPFKDKIIYDSIFACYPIVFGISATNDFKEIYLNAKQNKKIHFSL